MCLNVFACIMHDLADIVADRSVVGPGTTNPWSTSSSSSSSSTTPSGDAPPGPNIGLIVGLAVGGALLLAGGIIGGVVLYRRRRTVQYTPLA